MSCFMPLAQAILVAVSVLGCMWFPKPYIVTMYAFSFLHILLSIPYFLDLIVDYRTSCHSWHSGAPIPFAYIVLKSFAFSGKLPFLCSPGYTCFFACVIWA